MRVVDEQGFRELDEARVAAAVGGLPEAEKLVFTLSHYENTSDSEIAALLSQSEAKVAELRESAFQHLQHALQRGADPGPAITPARGSKLQVQIYVNRKSGQLSEAVLDALPSLASRTTKLAWVAPLEHEGFAEPQDVAFLRAVGYEDLAPELASFWPTRGPVWDALALAVLPSGRPGVVLVEGKSYPDELYGSGMQAKAAASQTKIEAALAATRTWLGVDGHAAAWTGPLYQSANRYAHLYWLREVAGVEAWLVHLLFVDDMTYRGASNEEWETALPPVEEELGLRNVQIPWAGHAFLPGLTPADLVAG